MFDTVWYDNLIKPFLTPPAWVFPPAWIILYATLLAALILYTIKFSRTKKLLGYIYFILQMFLNLAWSPAFFVEQNIKLALGIIILMDIFAILMLRRFFLVSKLAGSILIPYIIWILFATYLNIGFLLLN
jgi:tryptophan-rich sensory protein